MAGTAPLVHDDALYAVLVQVNHVGGHKVLGNEDHFLGKIGKGGTAFRVAEQAAYNPAGNVVDINGPLPEDGVRRLLQFLA